MKGLEKLLKRHMIVRGVPDRPARYLVSLAIAKNTQGLEGLPFGVHKAHFAAMSYWQNKRVLSSFWNYSWFGELFERMSPAEILSALYGSDIIKNKDEFRLWSEKNLASLFWEKEMAGLDSILKSDGLLALVGEGVYRLVRQANVWGYLSSEGVDGRETPHIPIIFALQKMARERGFAVKPGEEKRRIVEAAMSAPAKALRLIESALDERVYSNGEIEIGFRYAVIEADGGPPDKGWYVNENYRKLERLASSPQLIKAAARQAFSHEPH